MRPSLLIAFLLTTVVGRTQQVSIPAIFKNAFQNLKLNRKYDINGYLTPAFIQSDFNGDGVRDIAILVIEKSTRKKGFIILHGNSTKYFVFGAGTQFGNGSDDYEWAGKWSLYKHDRAYDMHSDGPDDSLVVAEAIELKRPGLMVENRKQNDSFRGGIIYWNNKEYIWIRQEE